MKRWLLIGVAIAVCGTVVIAGSFSFKRWSAGMVAATLAEARQAQQAGEDRAAAEHYERYLGFAGRNADPDVIVDSALLSLKIASQSHASPKDVGRAFAAAVEAIRRRPNDMRLRRRLADLQIAQGDFAGAREHLLLIRESIEKGTADDDPAEIELGLARTWLGTGDHEQALGIVAGLTGFDVAARSFIGNDQGSAPPPGAYLLLAEILRDKLEDPAATDTIIERCMQAHPDDPVALVPYSGLLLSRKDPEAALQTAARAEALAPTDPTAIEAHALALAATGDASAASITFLEGVRRLPKDRPLFASAARHLAVYGTPEQILEMLDRAWERLPYQEYAVLVFLTNMRIEWKARPEFAARLEEARKTQGADNPAVTVLEARVREAEGHWSAAEKPLVKARAVVPREAKRRIDELLARCLAMLGEPDEALVAYQRLEREPSTWWRASTGIAEALLELGHRQAAGEVVDRLCRRWTTGNMAAGAANLAWVFAPTLSPMIRVMAAQPVERQDWRGLEAMVTTLANSPAGAADSRIIMARAELSAAKGDLGAAVTALPAVTETAPTPQFDPVRISLIAARDGIAPMRAALAALPRWRRDRAPVLTAAAHAEAAAAVGDERDWIREYAAASDRITDAEEAVQLLQQLAGLARAAGWRDEARAIWDRASKRLPQDFRGHLAGVLDAARTGDAEAASRAAEQVVRIEGEKSPRSRVAAAAALIAAVRRAGGGKTAAAVGQTDSRRKQLDEAKALVTEAANDRQQWQPVAVLFADIESLAGNPAAAAVHLERAVEYGPDDPGLTLQFAATLDRCRRRADAERVRETVAPVGIGGGDRLGIEASLRAEDFRGAADRAIAVIDAEKADTATLLWLGGLCARAGLRERASAVLTRATRIDPSNPDAWLRLARYRMAEGEKEAAEETLAAGLDAVPADQRRLLAARGDAVVGRMAEAERGLRELVRQSGSSGTSAAFLVDLLFEQGRGKEAELFLQEVVSGRWSERPELRAWAESRLAALRESPRR